MHSPPRWGGPPPSSCSRRAWTTSPAAMAASRCPPPCMVAWRCMAHRGPMGGRGSVGEAVAVCRSGTLGSRQTIRMMPSITVGGAACQALLQYADASAADDTDISMVRCTLVQQSRQSVVLPSVLSGGASSRRLAATVSTVCVHCLPVVISPRAAVPCLPVSLPPLHLYCTSCGHHGALVPSLHTGGFLRPRGVRLIVGAGCWWACDEGNRPCMQP